MFRSRSRARQRIDELRHAVFGVRPGRFATLATVLMIRAMRIAPPERSIY